MKQKFKELAAVLQRQILTRLIFGGFLILLFVILICTTRDLILSLPCIVLGGYLVFNGVRFFYHCATGQVIAVTGKCVQIEHSKIRKRAKVVHIKTADKEISVPLRKRIRGLTIGVSLTLYIPEKARIYERDGKYIASSYYAVEMK